MSDIDDYPFDEINEACSFIEGLLEMIERRGLNMPPEYAWASADQETIDDAKLFVSEYRTARSNPEQ